MDPYFDGLLHDKVHWRTHDEELEALEIHFCRSVIHLLS